MGKFLLGIVVGFALAYFAGYFLLKGSQLGAGNNGTQAAMPA